MRPPTCQSCLVDAYSPDDLDQAAAGACGSASGRRRRRHRDCHRRRRAGAGSASQAAGHSRPRRARRSDRARGHRADQVHQPPDRLGEHRGLRPDPDGRDRPAVAGRGTPAARAAVRPRRRAGRCRRQDASGSTTARSQHRLPRATAAGLGGDGAPDERTRLPSLDEVQQASSTG